jgi:hypothetical protein
MSSSICTLNSNTKYCLPNESINLISQIIKKKSHINETPENIIINSAKELNCNTNTNHQEKTLCVVEKLIDHHKDTILEESLKKQVLKYFKPVAKKLDKEYWINNTEIDNIQFQLQTKYKGYYYSYIHMIDLYMFEPTNKDLLLNSHKIKCITDINFIDELENNTTLNYNGNLEYFGLVCNTDLSSGGGVHWFSIFIDFRPYYNMLKNNKYEPITIEYFNSSGYPITAGSHRNKFINYFTDLEDSLDKYLNEKFKTNLKLCKFIQATHIEHQRSDTANCGSYSLFYIYSRLNNVSISHFTNNKITDEEMEDFRKHLWRKKLN